MFDFFIIVRKAIFRKSGGNVIALMLSSFFRLNVSRIRSEKCLTRNLEQLEVAALMDILVIR